jgi:multidrug efflux pump subunit AcrB
MNENGWLSRPAAALAVLCGLCAVSIFFIQTSFRVPGISLSENRDESFTVVQRHYGMDAAEMERTAAVPLEDALSRIRGLKKIRSVSENGSVRVFAYFEGRSAGRYEAVREAAQEVYKTLPRSAQRPEILSSDGGRFPVWTAAVSAGGASAGRLLERTVKPALEALEGSGEVEISGAGLTEIIITVDDKKAAALGLDPRVITETLAGNDALFSGGKFNEGNREISIAVDGRYPDLQSLKSAVIPLQNKKSFIMLEDIAAVREEEKESQSRSRVNGKKTAVVAVMADGGADLGRLSELIKKATGKFDDLEFIVLSDRGAEERAAYRSVLGAAVQGALAVALMAAALCFRKGRRLLPPVCAFSVPVIILFAAALTRFFGFEFDKLVLAGLSSGAGAAVDAVILSADYLGNAASIAEGRKACASLRFPLIAGAATTIIALLPLGLKEAAPEIRPVAWAAGSVNFVSMVLALFLLPPLFLHTAGRPVRRLGKTRIKTRVLFRILAAHVRFCVQRPIIIAAFWLALTVFGITALILGGTDTGSRISEKSVYAQIEFEGGLHIDEVDRRLAVYGESIKNEKGILHVQTSARTGSGSVLAAFDPALLNPEKARRVLRSKPVFGGFVYIGESSAKERIWEVRISGDDETRCRKLAAEAARTAGNIPLVDETVLNFKDGRPRLTLKADRERLAEAGVSLSGLGGTLRYGIHGPVVYKRISAQGETDVRFRFPEKPGGRILQSVAAGASAPLEAGMFFSETEDREPSSIQRMDRRRSASISIRTRAMDPRAARDMIMSALSRLALPPGYSVEFDPDAVKAAEAVSGSAFLFILALVFCYMVIAAFKGSFLVPFAVLAVVPPSLSFSVLCMKAAGCPLDAVSASAFVAAAGLAVNAGVLIVDGLADSGTAAGLYRGLRRHLPALFATAGTTAAGALPFLFVGNASASVVRTLSLAAAFGVAASAFCSVSLIPALSKLFPVLFEPFNIGE